MKNLHVVLVNNRWFNIIIKRSVVCRNRPMIDCNELIVGCQGNLLLTGSWVQRDALQLWDYRQGALVKSIPLAHAAEGEYLYAARFLSAETLIAGGSGTNSAQLISLVTDKVGGATGRVANLGATRSRVVVFSSRRFRQTSTPKTNRRRSIRDLFF